MERNCAFVTGASDGMDVYLLVTSLSPSQHCKHLLKMSEPKLGEVRALTKFTQPGRGKTRWEPSLPASRTHVPSRRLWSKQG